MKNQQMLPGLDMFPQLRCSWQFFSGAFSTTAFNYTLYQLTFCNQTLDLKQCIHRFINACFKNSMG